MSEFSELAYALFALQQPLALAELAEGAERQQLVMADPQTPDWFAAAASAGSSLLDMAPELQVLPANLDQADQVDVHGIDLVHIYSAHTAEDEPEPQPEPVITPPPLAQPRTAVQVELLRELADLDD